jgi:flagellar biosynthetic protein FlhB
MADENEAASKTEEATPRRLEEARNKGEVAKSMDLAQVATMAGTFGVLAILGGWLARNLAMQLTPFLAHPETMPVEGPGGVAVARYAIMAAAPALGAVLGAAVLFGIGGHVLQTGLLFTPSKVSPDLSKVNPMQGFKRLFGIDNLMAFLRSVLKVILTGAVAWWVLSPHAQELTLLPTMEPTAILAFGVKLCRDLGFAVLILLGAGAGIDFLWQRQRFAARMRMTKEELKEDFKQSEGDPHVKARQRQIRNERARRRMIQAVPSATVVLMNPTHYAVALRYEAGETPAPECVAKGVDELALRIRAVAEEAGVPVVEDAPLARALYASVEVDDVIPQQHYQAVAKVIGFVMSAAKSTRRAAQL